MNVNLSLTEFQEGFLYSLLYTISKNMTDVETKDETTTLFNQLKSEYCKNGCDQEWFDHAERAANIGASIQADFKEINGMIEIINDNPEMLDKL